MNTFLSLSRTPVTQLDPVIAITCLVVFIAIVYVGVKKGYAKAASTVKK